MRRICGSILWNMEISRPNWYYSPPPISLWEYSEQRQITTLVWNRDFNYELQILILLSWNYGSPLGTLFSLLNVASVSNSKLRFWFLIPIRLLSFVSNFLFKHDFPALFPNSYSNAYSKLRFRSITLILIRSVVS